VTGVSAQKVLAWLIGDRGRLRTIRFREGSRRFRAQVPEDNLWGAVKDNLVLGEYERAGIRLPDMRGVVVDAGAHVGLFSLLASTYARTVLALEAHPANFSLLAGNIAANGAHNVEVRHCALWSKPGYVDFVEGQQTGSGSILGRNGRTFAVRAETLDRLVESAGPVDLLKLDIEGAELAVLDHASEATLRQIAAVVAEVHLDEGDERLFSMLDRLRSYGFDVLVRKPPAAHWREAVVALGRNRRRLCGEIRLRVAVAVLYSLIAARRVYSPRQGDDALCFLYARRVSAVRAR
jgi:FkbM family methyltransferase